MPKTFGKLGNRSGAKFGIALVGNTVEQGAANNTTVGTASIRGSYTGTPSWSITDASGTFQINSSSGVITVLDNTDLTPANPTFSVTISVSGTTPDPADIAALILCIDTTAPTLTSESATATGTTTADLDVSTDEGEGTLYWVVTQSATGPTALQVKTGKSHTGAAADKAGNQAVSATGAQGPISVTALTQDVTYYAHFMHEDEAGNRSTVVSSDAFTPAEAVGTPAAPQMTWATPGSDDTPDFDINLPSGALDETDAAAGDVLRIQYQTAGGDWSSPTLYLTHTLDAGDIIADTITESASAIAEGDYDFRARLERGGNNSDWTADVSVTIDTTAPTVSTFSPTDGATGVAIDANLVVTFDEDVQFAATVDISIHLVSDNSVVEAFDEGDIGTLISISGAALTINPTASFSGLEDYYVLIDAVAVEDLAGNAFAGIASSTTWNFTTAASEWSDPTDAEGTLEFWFDASQNSMYTDNGTTLAADLDRVQQWSDLSGNGRHLRQSGANNKPFAYLTTGAINGLPVLNIRETDGVGGPQYMDMISPGTIAPPYITFIVFRQAELSARGTPGMWIDSNELLVQHHAGLGNKAMVLCQTDAEWTASTIDPITDDTDYAAYTKTTSTSMSIKVSGEGSEVTTGSQTNGNSTSFRLGPWDPGSNVTWLNIWVGEIFRIKDYTADDITKAVTYLTNKWGVAP